jgi:glutathione S-transferase
MRLDTDGSVDARNNPATPAAPDAVVAGPPAVALHDGCVVKLRAGYDWLERNLDVCSDLHIGHIALATTLSWIEFRQLPSLREQHPKLAKWFDQFESRPSMHKTPLSGETHD